MLILFRNTSIRRLRQEVYEIGVGGRVHNPFSNKIGGSPKDGWEVPKTVWRVKLCAKPI